MPCEPCHPWTPAAPVAPRSPGSPTTPGVPCIPRGPGVPAGPLNPRGPLVPLTGFGADLTVGREAVAPVLSRGLGPGRAARNISAAPEVRKAKQIRAMDDLEAVHLIVIRDDRETIDS